MTSQRKKLYIYAGINFLMGTVIGIVLFYGQMRHNPAVFSAEYSYDKTLEIIDFFRAWWTNTMWLFAVFMTQGFVRSAPLHVMVGIRGVASSYCSMYIANYLGIKECVISVLPQCMTILPLIIWFSVTNSEKRINEANSGAEGAFMKRIDSVKIFLFSMISAALETTIFAFLCYCLF